MTLRIMNHSTSAWKPKFPFFVVRLNEYEALYSVLAGQIIMITLGTVIPYSAAFGGRDSHSFFRADGYPWQYSNSPSVPTMYAEQYFMARLAELVYRSSKVLCKYLFALHEGVIR